MPVMSVKAAVEVLIASSVLNSQICNLAGEGEVEVQ